MTAINKSPNVFSSTVQHTWHPSVDGHFIARNPYVSIRNGQYAKVCAQFLFLFSFHTSTVEIWSWRHFLTGSVGDRRLRWRGNVRELKQFIHPDNLYLVACSRSPTLRTYPCCVPHSTYLCSQNWIAITRSFWRILNPSMWHCFFLQSKVVLILRQLLRWIAYNRAADWNWPGVSRRHNKGDCFCFLLLWKGSYLFFWYVSVGVSFRHWNLERYDVSNTSDFKVIRLMNTQTRIQATSCHSRWHCVSSTSQIPPGKHSRDTTCIRILYFFFQLYLWCSKSSSFCQCSNVANLLRCLERSTVPIFPSSLDLALIQTSLELMLLVCFSGVCMLTMLLLTYHGVNYHSVNFANTGNPTTPHNPNSLLSTVDWKPWSSSSDHPLLTFLDPAPDVSITFDNFRVPEINLLNNIFLHFASGSLDTGSMNEAVTVNPDDKTDKPYILRSDEEL